MANFISVYVLIGLIPIGFLVAACYSSHQSVQTAEHKCCPALSETRSPGKEVEIEMQDFSAGRYGVERRDRAIDVGGRMYFHTAVGMSPVVHDSARAAIHSAIQTHTASTCAGRTKPIPGTKPKEPFRAPSAVTTTDSVTATCTVAGSRANPGVPVYGNWWEDAGDDDVVVDGRFDPVPAFARTTFVPGKYSAFRPQPQSAFEVVKVRGGRHGI